VKQIKEWRAAGDRIILFVDHNKHVINGTLRKELADKEGPDLQEAIVHHMGTSPGVTFFQGSKQINELWVSINLDISNACVMPFGYGIGNNRTFILDILIKSLVGVDPIKIAQPAGRQLNSRLLGCSQLYIDSLEGNITRHCLLEQLFKVHTGNTQMKEGRGELSLSTKKERHTCSMQRRCAEK
jgi:hypothetical protein